MEPRVTGLRSGLRRGVWEGLWKGVWHGALRAASIALTVAALLLGVLAGTAGAEESDLEALREQIRKSRERVGAHERQERALLEQLEESDQLSAALAIEVRQARAAADEARESSVRFAAELVRASASLDATREAMAKRVVALYKAGDVGTLRFVFAASSIREVMNRVAALERFVSYDARLVERYARETSELEVLGARAREAAESRDTTAKRLEARSSELALVRAERRALLRRAREDRTQERGLLVELEKAARALEETLAALGENADKSANRLYGQEFAARRGALARPLPTKIVERFGRVVDEKFRTETFRKGVEFDAAGGESVLAVAPGVVRFAGWFRGYGKLVILDQGDEYFTVMGHLAEIFVEVGDAVSEGEMLGTVGDTGSLSGPRLYFEIRRGAEPLDPAEWLRPKGAVRASAAP
jgi:septal ring factor EnvC (AmiA/AmiB activator)